MKFEKYNIVSVCALESEFYVKSGKKKEEQDGDKRTWLDFVKESRKYFQIFGEKQESKRDQEIGKR